MIRVVAATLGLLAFSFPAIAAKQHISTMWMVEEATAHSDPFDLASRDYVLKHRLLPTGLAQLVNGSSSPGLGEMVAGKQLVELQSGTTPIYCDPVIRPKKLVGHAQHCLVDADRDGRFEGFFTTSSVTKGILTIQGALPKRFTSVEPIAYRQIEPRTFDQDLFLGVQYRGDANLVGNHIFEIRYGSADDQGSLTKRILHKKSNVPGSTDVLGARFTILEAGGGRIRTRIDQPIPSQPFAVLQTTTYRIY